MNFESLKTNQGDVVFIIMGERISPDQHGWLRHRLMEVGVERAVILPPGTTVETYDDRSWRPMATAPKDGTVIEVMEQGYACGSVVSWRAEWGNDENWRLSIHRWGDESSTVTRPIAWRPYNLNWPQESDNAPDSTP